MLAEILSTVKDKVNLITNKLSQFQLGLAEKSALYSRPQKLYALSVLTLLLFSDSLWISVLIAFSALIMECLPIIHFIWRSLLGKALILLVYAVIANFALANASSVVNQVTGVSSDYFTYGHNFAILLYIPTWIAAITVIGLLFFQVISIIYVSTVILILKPLHLVKKFSISKYPHPVLTMALRTALTLNMMFFIQGLSENSIIQDTKLVQFHTESQPVKKVPEANTQALKTDETLQKQQLLNEIIADINADDSNNDIKFFIDAVKTLKRQGETGTRKIEQLVAHFIFYFDSDEKTRCTLDEHSHGVVLNDYEVLQITPDETQESLYHYKIRTCISPAFPESYYRGG